MNKPRISEADASGLRVGERGLMDTVTPVEREALLKAGWWVHDGCCWHPPEDTGGNITSFEDRLGRLSQLLGRSA